jgi:hypothetical protein
MSTQTLYQIGADMAALDALLCEVGGDVSEAEAEAAINDWLEQNCENLREKLDDYGAVMRAMEADAAFCREEASRLLDRATVRENNVKRLKERLRWFFEAQGIDKVETPRFRFSLANNGGKVPVSVTIPPETLPEWCRKERVSYSADMDAIRERLQAGEVLDFAVMGERGRHIRVR